MSKPIIYDNLNNDSLDDLLGDIPPSKKYSAPSATLADDLLSGKVTLKEGKLPTAPLARASKPRKVPTNYTPKGVLVRFTTKTGVLVEGFGVEYYVVRHGGKLHYKEASQVTILSEDNGDLLHSDVEIEDIDVPYPQDKLPSD